MRSQFLTLAFSKAIPSSGLVLAALALNVVLATPALGATYHVATNGNNANQGTASSPYKTVQRGVDALKPGDTLLIHAGRYAGFSASNLQGTANAPITIRAATGEKVTLDGFITPQSQLFIIMLTGQSAYLVIDGLELTSTDPKTDEFRKLKFNTMADCEAFYPRMSEYTGVRRGIRLEGTGAKRSHHVTFKNLNIHHFVGLGFSGDLDDSQFLDNHVYDLGYPTSGYGWYTHGARNVWRDNVVHDTTYGFHLYGFYETGVVFTDDSVIERTLIYNIGKRGTWCFHSGLKPKTGGTGLLIGPGTGNIIRNNIVAGNHKGVIVRTSATPVVNNTFFQNQGSSDYGGGLEVMVGNGEVKNNIFFANFPFNYKGTGPVTATNFEGDPKFVNAASRNFRVLAGSPVIDQGSTLAVVSNDFAGVSRPKGNAYDIGAFEFTNMTAVAPNAPSSLEVH